MNVSPTSIAGVLRVDTVPHADSRGAFARLYCERNLADVIGPRRIVQINHSRTATVGAIRGMHYQHPPHAEMKLVRCLRGRVWDVAVDLRAGSPTFLRWHAEELTPHNARMLVIPEGCAHGFQVLEADSELLYLHTAFYAPQAEGGVRHDDPRLGITWPLPVAELSPRDAGHPKIEPDYRGIPA
jgi:dTDP-4-dehydrorhamnose 3,5-epimerase